MFFLKINSENLILSGECYTSFESLSKAGVTKTNLLSIKKSFRFTNGPISEFCAGYYPLFKFNHQKFKVRKIVVGRTSVIPNLINDLEF